MKDCQYKDRDNDNLEGECALCDYHFLTKIERDGCCEHEPLKECEKL